MSKSFDYFFDYGSPYSYLADTQLKKLAEKTDSLINYKPVLIGGIFKQTGNKPPIQNPVKEKVAYGLKDIGHWQDYYQIPFAWNPFFPVNTLPLMRIATALQFHEKFPNFHDAAFKSVWVEKRNMNEIDEIKKLLTDIKLDAEKIIEDSQQADSKEALKRNTEEAVNYGIFGLPAFRVNDELLFGNDRLLILEHLLRKS